MLAPRRAELREVELPRRDAEGTLKGTTGDEEPGAGKKYEYRVTAVDTHGNESQPATVPVELQ